LVKVRRREKEVYSFEDLSLLPSQNPIGERLGGKRNGFGLRRESKKVSFGFE